MTCFRVIGQLSTGGPRPDVRFPFVTSRAHLQRLAIYTGLYGHGKIVSGRVEGQITR